MTGCPHSILVVRVIRLPVRNRAVGARLDRMSRSVKRWPLITEKLRFLKWMILTLISWGLRPLIRDLTNLLRWLSPKKMVRRTPMFRTFRLPTRWLRLGLPR